MARPRGGDAHRGLRVVMPGKDLRMKVRALHLGELATERPAFDVVLLAAKSYDTVWMCHLIAPYLADDGVFVGLQNGMNEEMITPIVGSERTIACVVELSAEIWQPGWCSATPPGTGPGSRWASSTARSPSGPRKWHPAPALCQGGRDRQYPRRQVVQARRQLDDDGPLHPARAKELGSGGSTRDDRDLGADRTGVRGRGGGSSDIGSSRSSG